MELVLDLAEQERNFIEACKLGEKWAQKKLYEDNVSIMFPVCLRYAKDENEAMDIMHEGFIKVFRNIEKYTPGTSMKAWIKRIMVNSAIDHYRKQSRKRVYDLDQVYDKFDDSPTAIEDLSAQEILNALGNLSSSYRMVFSLYVIDGYSHKEIAKKMGITESTSRSNLVKARKKLRQELKMMYGKDGFERD